MNATNYYFRKLARFVQPREYHHVKMLRARTNPQISLDELLFLRWGIRYFRPQTLVEIGSFCGASTSIMADAVKALGKGRIYAIDLFTHSGGGKGHGGIYWTIFDQTMQPYRGWFEKITGDSITIQWDRPIDMLFIDGDHSETGVSADIEKYTPFIRLGGGVFLHDYVDEPGTDSRVKMIVDRTLLQNPRYRRVGLVRSLIAFKKVAP